MDRHIREDDLLERFPSGMVEGDGCCPFPYRMPVPVEENAQGESFQGIENRLLGYHTLPSLGGILCQHPGFERVNWGNLHRDIELLHYDIRSSDQPKKVLFCGCCDQFHSDCRSAAHLQS